MQIYAEKLIDTNTNFLEKRDLKDEIDQEVSHLKRPVNKEGTYYFFVDPEETEDKISVTLLSIHNLERQSSVVIYVYIDDDFAFKFQVPNTR